ncbi:MAG: DUF3368 domain-containing protein [Thermoproteota archaeon]
MANTSVILAFSKLGYLKLLREVFDKIVVSESVFEEVKDSEVFTQLSELIHMGFMEVTKVVKPGLLDLMSSSLGKGEAEAIALASELKADFVLLDDLKARKTARKLGLKVMGTLAVLKTLIHKGSITETPEYLCKRLIDQGFWIDEKLCTKILGE